MSSKASLIQEMSGPSIGGLFIIFLIVSVFIYLLPRLPSFIYNLRLYHKYAASHRSFSLAAGKGHYDYLIDPFSYSNNYWLCRHSAIKHAFSRSSIHEIDHRAGFDWFHEAGWEIPTTDPRFKDTVREADQTVHRKLATSKLTTLLETVQRVGFGEVDRIKGAVGPEGKVVSMHSLLYRLGYNVNCIGIFGPDLDHVATRVILQTFTEKQHIMFNSFNWPLPLWLTTLLVPGCRQTAKARQGLYNHLQTWYHKGGIQTASEEMKAIVQVFEQANSPPDISSKFLNMMMVAFLANTPETLGWFFTHLLQAPNLFAAVRAEIDALDRETSLVTTPFKSATPYLYSALFETFRLYVFTGTPATVIKPCTLPGIDGKVFQPGDIIHSMQEACSMDVSIFGEDVESWKGHRFVGEKGESLLRYDLTFGIGRSPCPGRNFAIAELCTLAARLVQTFSFSSFQITQKLSFEDGDFDLYAPVTNPGMVEIIDLDGSLKKILHPGNKSDRGIPGMTAANVPMNDFACRLAPRG